MFICIINQNYLKCKKVLDLLLGIMYNVITKKKYGKANLNKVFLFKEKVLNINFNKKGEDSAKNLNSAQG